MKLIIDFYKGLDTLNLIIFWGIIIVIILLLIFSIIMINKNKKLKKIVEDNTNKYEAELPIKKEETKEEEDIIIPINSLPQSSENETNKEVEDNTTIEEEKEFIAEEHIMEYKQELPKEPEVKKTIEMPTGPYQRNVLREMSLSQTSPIGINRQIKPEENKIALAKELSNALNEEIGDTQEETSNIKNDYNENNHQKLNEQIKKDLSNILTASTRKTEIEKSYPQRNYIEIKPRYEEQKKQYNKEFEKELPKELLDISSNITGGQNNKNASAKYLEEVSKKLSEAEIPDEIERTNYELQQEEDAIISYKELMEKKDSIQTIDEEEAIISIEELMNRKNNETKEKQLNDDKLYNLTESEENDDFIKELKQFRKDL